MWFECVIKLRRAQGNSKIHIGVTLGLQVSNGYPTVTQFILIRALGPPCSFDIWNKTGLIF